MANVYVKDSVMLDVKVDLLKNRLYLTLGLGRVQKKKTGKALAIIEKAAGKLEPGFSCIARILDAKDMNSADIEAVKTIQRRLVAFGMTRVVRVGSEHGKQLLSLLGKEIRHMSLDAADLEEAEFLLDEWARKDTPPEEGLPGPSISSA